MKKMSVVVILSSLIFFVSFKPAGFAGMSICGPQQGEFLYKKHCIGCHHDAAKLKRGTDLASSIRNPPAAMPQFGKDRISDFGVQEIVDYIRGASEVQPVSKKDDVSKMRSTVAQRQKQ